MPWVPTGQVRRRCQSSLVVRARVSTRGGEPGCFGNAALRVNSEVEPHEEIVGYGSNGFAGQVSLRIQESTARRVRNSYTYILPRQYSRAGVNASQMAARSASRNVESSLRS